SGEMIAGENPAHAAARDEELCVVGFAEARAATGECSEIPCAARERGGRQILSRGCGCKEQAQKHGYDDFHFSRLSPVAAWMQIEAESVRQEGNAVKHVTFSKSSHECHMLPLRRPRGLKPKMSHYSSALLKLCPDENSS